MDEKKLEELAAIHPLLPEKLKADEEDRTSRREGQRYKLLYEKTYAGNNPDSYETSLKAANNEEAIMYAQKKLVRLDMMARWDTDITDALLFAPNGDKILIPGFSKELRKEK